MANKKGKSSKKKRNSILFKLVSTAKTGYFYLIRRNPKQKKTKSRCRKYDPKVKKHVWFEEKKISKS